MASIAPHLHQRNNKRVIYLAICYPIFRFCSIERVKKRFLYSEGV